ncbi:MAG: MlaC/ttg2D family ABC transporter substrate-binding protein [bacterium]
MIKKSLTVVLIVIGFMALTPPGLQANDADTSTPRQIVEKNVRKIQQLLEDTPIRTAEDLHDMRPRFQEIIEPLFGFEEITLRTLGRHARAIDDRQLAELVELYRELLENIVLNNLAPVVENNDTPLPVPEVKISGAETRKSGSASYARVYSTARINQEGETMEIELNFRMVNRQDDWLVYDLEIEGVSMVQNYRSQFDEIITNKSIAKLIDSLKEKIKQFQESPEKAREEAEDWLPDTDK